MGSNRRETECLFLCCLIGAPKFLNRIFAVFNEWDMNLPKACRKTASCPVFKNSSTHGAGLQRVRVKEISLHRTDGRMKGNICFQLEN
ncbi:hypothetical protein HNY73_008098 [Argiope bruennichi]|uniref:Uncharacterized protein n=1 Tax=Argiope bruennichi TaxID=94029 RepID=A0A8T0F5I5_ARGBR|nr:hypothetical protein HNY73_008098 [Argiope bruennichi]